MRNNSLTETYRLHHKLLNKRGFSLLENQRGAILSKAIGTGKDILDLGCRDGTLTRYFSAKNHVLGIDIDEELLVLAKQNLGIETLKLDLNGNWSEIRERKFDIVVAGEVLEHLYYPEEVVKKIKQCLRPGGKLIGSVPNSFHLKNRFRLLMGSKRHTPLADPMHINHFSEKDLRAVLKICFTKVRIIGLGRYSFLSRVKPGYFAYNLMFECK